jgi:hypothetical protein
LFRFHEALKKRNIGGSSRREVIGAPARSDHRGNSSTRSSSSNAAIPALVEDALGRLGLRWETISEGPRRWLVIYDFPLPSGYTVVTVSMAIEMPAGYPPGALDMAYFHPPLSRVNGNPMLRDPTQRIVVLLP